MIQRPRLGALPISPPETADVWLIRLRWVAICGMLGTILVAKRLLPPLPMRAPLSVLAGIVVLNLAWVLVPRPRVDLQIYADVLALTAMLWVTGGATNPFAAFLTFHIVLAGLLCGARTAIAIALLALAAILVLRMAPPLPIAGEKVIHLGELVSLGSLAAFMCFFVLVYVQRVEQLRAEGARNEKLAILGRLVGSMSHELNTPLATILLASKDLVTVAADDETKQLAQTIVSEAQRASDLIGLMRGQLRADQPASPVDLAALAREIATKELDRLGFAGARVLPPDEVSATVIAVGVRHVLVNLLANAVQAPAARITVRVERKGKKVEVSVEDDGPGIDRELLPRLGEPFATTKGPSGGFGLGLYISGMLAERMGGTLRVETPDTGGTRVILSLEDAP